MVNWIFYKLLLRKYNDDSKLVDVICFNETFVKNGSESNIKLNNLKLVASFCHKNSQRGACILKQRTLDVKPVPLASKLASKLYFKCCGVEILYIGHIVVNTYRIPGNTKAFTGTFLHINSPFDY